MKALLWFIGLVSRVWPWLGSKIAWYLWFHPHGRPNTGYPESSEKFDIEVAGHKTSGYTLGLGDPVLLLHGWGGASTDMAPLASSLAGAGFGAVVPDLPGHGTDRGTSSDVFRMAATVDAVAHRFGSPRAVIAHSFGAVVTFATFPYGGPERVVLVAPAVAGISFLATFNEQANLGDKAFRLFEQRFVSFAGPHLVDVMNGEGDVPGADMLILHDPADDRTSFADAAVYADGRPATKIVEVPNSGHKGILRDSDTRAETVAFVLGG